MGSLMDVRPRRICFFAVATMIMALGSRAAADGGEHSFQIGETDFLLDGKPFVIRSGEMHAARIPHEYWRHRLKMVRAMGCNTVCAYLFWNQHEPKPGQFDFSGAANVAEYCRIAQEEGLWVILRPGPYSCAEWDFGGFPWWLLKYDDIKLRTRDARYMEAFSRYAARVGKELAGLQITHGGPILMVQVENEYGSYGNDKEYIGAVRDAWKAAGFDVPMFTCDGPTQLRNDTRTDLFCVVNFGSDPESNFKALREIRAKGPLACGEYYPGWFDSWGAKHHTGETARVAKELAYMLEHRQSFSIYMVHGGTSFGFSAGANCPPFRPQTTSYDYDAPIDEAGRATAKFTALRELFGKHLNPGETLTDVPAANPMVAIPEIQLTEFAGLFENVGEPTYDKTPRPMELHDQAQGFILYSTTLEPGEEAVLRVREARDYAQIYVAGKRVGVIDRRCGSWNVTLPPREGEHRLDILVEAMGRVNYGAFIHDRKGISERVELIRNGVATELVDWQVYIMPIDDAYLKGMKFGSAGSGGQGPGRAAGATDAGSECGRPGVYHGSFQLKSAGDSFLDMRGWSKGMVWVNGHNLGRYWNIGPQQTLYLPGCWLKQGENEILVLDATGDTTTHAVRGLAAPILDELGPDPLMPGKHRRADQRLSLAGVKPAFEGAFAAGEAEQKASFAAVKGRYLCLEARNSQKPEPFTSCAELNVVDTQGNDVPRERWRVVYADSEELSAEDGSATNVFDGDKETFWHTEWESAKPGHPHAVVIDMGAEYDVAGIRYVPRQVTSNGRIREYRVFVWGRLVEGL